MRFMDERVYWFKEGDCGADGTPGKKKFFKK